jgi:hypothetical protein
MAKDVADYRNDCLRCQKSATAKHKPYGQLAPLQPPQRPWQEVTFDFITDLPPSKMCGLVYNAMMVVVCRLTKLAHYILAKVGLEGN